MKKQNYRKIYEDHFGPIPKDEQGRSFEIHHIDGNRKNNDISNLVALSILDHYETHLTQGDYAACLRIASKFGMDKETISELAREAAIKGNKKRIENGTHHFLGGEIQKQRVENGTHNFLGDKNPNYAKVKNGTHHLLGGAIQREIAKKGENVWQKNPDLVRKINENKILNGTHPFQNQKKVSCPHCGKIGANGIMHRFHFDKCKTRVDTNNKI